MADGPYFHLYTLSARRVLFYASWPAKAFGPRRIKSTDLLFGLLHEGKIFFAERKIGKEKLESMESACGGVPSKKVPPPTDIFIAYDKELTTILYRAAQEMLNRHHEKVDIQHLLLGLLHVPSPAKDILNKHGLLYETESRRVPFHARTEAGPGEGLDYT